MKPPRGAAFTVVHAYLGLAVYRADAGPDGLDAHVDGSGVRAHWQVERGDRAEVRLLAHKLKGSSASLGAIRLRDRCQELELGGDEVELGAPQIAELRVVAAEASEALRQELVG